MKGFGLCTKSFALARSPHLPVHICALPNAMWKQFYHSRATCDAVMINKHTHWVSRGHAVLLERTSCCHNSTWKGSFDSNLMEEDSHKKLCKISGASICVSLQVKDHSMHAVNFTKMTHLNSLMHCFWLKKKIHSKQFCSFILKR